MQWMSLVQTSYNGQYNTLWPCKSRFDSGCLQYILFLHQYGHTTMYACMAYHTYMRHAYIYIYIDRYINIHTSATCGTYGTYGTDGTDGGTDGSGGADGTCRHATRIQTSRHTDIQTRIHTYILAHTYAHTYTHIRTHRHTYTHMHAYVHSRIHTYTYIHGRI